MEEQIIIESKKPVKFDPYCVRCGRKTKRRFYFIPPHLILTSILGSFMGLLVHLILMTDSNRVWVPYCLRCRVHYMMLGGKGIYHIIAAFVFMGVGFFLMFNQWFIAGLLMFVCVFIALFMASRSSRDQRADAMPFSINIEQGKIIYVFTSGDFHEKQMQQMQDEDEMVLNANQLV